MPTALAHVLPAFFAVLAQLVPTCGMVHGAVAFQFALYVPYSAEKGGASELPFPQLCHLAAVGCMGCKAVGFHSRTMSLQY